MAIHHRVSDSTRRMRLERALKHGDILVLQHHEAARFLGISVGALQKLVKHRVLKCARVSRTRYLFDADDLECFLLRKARTSEEYRQVLLDRVRFEARNLEKYPQTLRVAFTNGYEIYWELVARRLDMLALPDAAAEVRAVVEQVRERLRIETIEN